MYHNQSYNAHLYVYGYSYCDSEWMGGVSLNSNDNLCNKVSISLSMTVEVTPEQNVRIIHIM